MSSISAFPLQWPASWARTKAPQSSRFETSFAKARDNLVQELERFGAQHAVLSTNVELRLDGLPYAGRPEPSDRGVAVYFLYDGKQICIPCDRWNRVQDNIQAIARTLDALRSVDRWGTGKMLNAAFTGFVALSDKPHWRTVLDLASDATLKEAEVMYRVKARNAHPDNGGSHDLMAELNRAIGEARKELT